MLNVFVGTSTPEHTPAERALEHTLRKHCGDEVKIVFMDNFRSDPRWQGWNIGRPFRLVAKARPSGGWYTDFTCFRFSIPEAMNFEGRALYLDVDMLCLRDPQIIMDTLDEPGAAPIAGASLDVMAIDCAWFAGKKWWPSIEQMKASGWRLHQYGQLLESHGAMTFRHRHLESFDGVALTKETVILHYTSIETQPWKPYPHIFDHPETHPNERAQKEWDRVQAEMSNA